MNASRLAPLALSLSALTGAALGAITRLNPIPFPNSPHATKPRLDRDSPPHSPSVPAPSSPSDKPPESAQGTSTPQDPNLPNASETLQFATLNPEEQNQILSRLSAKFPASRETPPSLRLWIHRAVAQLSAEQAGALLETLAAGQKNEKDSAAKSALASRLAALDPQMALELGKKLTDPKITGAALAVIAQKDGGEALQTIAKLPKEWRNEALFNANQQEGLQKVGGSFHSLTQALKEHPELLENPQSNWALNGLLGNVLGQLALEDPKAALAQIRDLAQSIEALKPQETSPDNSGGRRGRRSNSGPHSPSPISGTIDNALSEMRSAAPQAASAFYDTLSEKEKSPWMASVEAASRLNASGVEAAVSFAEKQTNDEALRSAALGTWWSLAEKDPASASAWIDSLPAGPFRQGVLTAVMLNAWNQSGSWGNLQTAVDAGLKLSSKNAQLDYFTNLMTDRHGPPKSTEVLQELPLSPNEKIELIRRLAPIKSESNPR